jgi:hypothetical protein
METGPFVNEVPLKFLNMANFHGKLLDKLYLGILWIFEAWLSSFSPLSLSCGV